MADPHANPIHISKTVTILRKRPCPVLSSSSTPTVTSTTGSASSTAQACFRGRDVAPLRHLIDRLDADVSSVHEQRQQAALRRVTDALNTPCPAGQFAAICVHTGTSGASGDSSTFDGVVRHIEATSRANVVLLHPSRHDSLRSISDTLNTAVDAITAAAEEDDEGEEDNVEQGRETKTENRKLIVGVELTHLFHPDLLSDLIYLMSHIHQSSPAINGYNIKLSAAALFGISYSNALHDCLNVGDMVMLRTTIVRMPTPYELFDGVVHVLSQRQGVVFNRSVFELLYSHFIQHDTSLSMVLRTLRQLITLHFSSCPLVDLLLLIDDNSESSRERLVKLLTQGDGKQTYLHIIDKLSSVRSLIHQANGGDKQTAQTFAGNDDTLRAQQYAQCLYDLCKWKRNIAKLNAFTLQLDAIVDAKNVINGSGNSISQVFTNAAAQLHQHHCQDQSSSVQTALTFASFLPHHNAQTQIPGAVYLTKAQKFIRTAQRAELKRILTAIVDHFGTASPSNKSDKPTTNMNKATKSWFDTHADLSAQQIEDEVFATRANELMSLLESNSANTTNAMTTPTTSVITNNNCNDSVTTSDASTQPTTPKTPRRQQLTTSSPNPTATPTSSISRRRATGAQAARALRNQLLRTNVVEAQQQQKMLPIGNVRDGVSRLLHEMFTRQKCLYMLPCHEVVLFSDVSALQVAGGGLCSTVQPRHAIFTALRTPSKVFPLFSKSSQLTHSLSKDDDDDIMDDVQEHKNSIPPVPDIVVAFRILAQGGRLVSLYDWYHTFASSISATHIHAQQQRKQDEPSDGHVNITIAELQARFARACSELELLGLLKYTNRKTDHVARLAYE